MTRAALYLRVSTDRQTTDNQERELLAVAKQRGWEIAGIYNDDGISGAKSREYRRQFDALLKDATRGQFDVVMAWSVDRLGRSLKDLVAFLDEIQSVGVDLYLHQQGIDTTTPAGKAMFQMVGVFAEFERSMIQERVRAGLERARAKGKRLGRPRRLTPSKVRAVKDLRAEGASLRQIAAKTGLGLGSVGRALEMQV